MNNKPNAVFSGATWVLVVIIILALGCGRFGGSPGGVETRKMTIPAIAPDEPFPALNADVFDALSAEVPELAKHREEVMAAEREAIKGVLDDMRAKSKTANMTRGDAADNLRTSTTAPCLRADAKNAAVSRIGNEGWAGLLIGGRFDLVPVAMAAEADLSSLGNTQQFLIGHQVGFLMVADLGNVTQLDVGSRSVTLRENGKENGKVIADMTISVDTAGGPPTTELTTTISMPTLGLEANSKVSLTGELCPDSNGKVDFTIRLSSNGRSGRAGSVFYDKNIEARVRVTVGDDANIVSSDLDMRQTTRSTSGNIQSSVSWHNTGSDLQLDEAKFVEAAGPDGVDSRLKADGLARAYNLAKGALESAKEHWQGGKCVKIEATSPGKVQPSSTTAIPVTVRHLLDGSEVPSKLDAVLKGEKSVDPTSIARTAGNLTYTAPNEKDKKATISLTATSRRGRATLDLAANTGGQSYRVSGVSNNVSFSGEICSLEKPFVINGTFPGGGSAATTFEGGATTMSGGGGGCTQSGGGNYTVTTNENGSGTITWTSTAVLSCPGVNNKRTVTFTLPLQPAPDLACH
jgi:hypothetical protein